jgi:hypothetical protein
MKIELACVIYSPGLFLSLRASLFGKRGNLMFS